MVPKAFTPHYGSNVPFTLGAAGTAIINVQSQDQSIRIVNTGSGDLYVAAYYSTAIPYVASNKDMRVLPGMASVINIGNADRASVYSLAGTTGEVMGGNNGV